MKSSIVLCSVLLVACGETTENFEGPGGGGGAAGNGGGGRSPGHCDAGELAEPRASTTYYVAIAEPGADNDACDGLAPADEGGGRCPFKDLSAPRVTALLSDAADVRVELRAGTYLVYGWDGLQIHGAGASEAQRVILSGYPGEEAVLDVPIPDGAGCTTPEAPNNPDCVRQVVRMSGQYAVLQGLTIQNGLAYDAEVNGGAHHQVRCNRFTYTAEFFSRSDQLKLDGGAQDVVVSDNEFTAWHSQAIDMTEVFDVLVERNDFHHPAAADGGATGAKFGTGNVVIRDNDVHDLGADPTAHAFSLGGTGSPHADEFEAYEIHVVGNRVWNVAGKLAQLVSCRSCSVEDNDVADIGWGILLSAASELTMDECTLAPGGVCLPSEGTRISGNRLRHLDAPQAEVFIAVESTAQAAGLLAADNVYCAAAARFGWPNGTTGAVELVDFAAWQAASGTDDSSLVLDPSDPRCAD